MRKFLWLLMVVMILNSSAAVAGSPGPSTLGPLVAFEVQLTTSEEMDYIPSFSPDGKRMVFTSYATGREEIWVMDLDGTHARPLTNGPNGNWSPAWSPDGKAIAFTSNRSGANQIWLMDANGSNPRPLTQADPLPTTWSRDPSWSRDGTMIIFTSNRTGKDENWIMDLATQKQWPHSIGMAEHWHPSFSPDGQQVLFSSNMSGAWGLWLSDLRGGNLVRLAADKRFDNNPAASWSPDGKRIVFRTADSNLWIMDSNGSSPSPLTVDGMVDGWRSSWSPDGKKIAYTSLRSGNSDIWLITLKIGARERRHENDR
ncbi:MAG: PD40 domain-containing protein [Nitrospirae bacterium]|nr:PD40 domain-containing protein [Nitrospirota bacterium]